ncbi:MAG: InlB B-repeat-containing protein, partial [Oscillospiraceae bacterium]|nr:InlB B-repeat-containing protein [Oscillospiraceae bacterium]
MKTRIVKPSAMLLAATVLVLLGAWGGLTVTAADETANDTSEFYAKLDNVITSGGGTLYLDDSLAGMTLPSVQTISVTSSTEVTIAADSSLTLKTASNERHLIFSLDDGVVLTLHFEGVILDGGNDGGGIEILGTDPATVELDGADIQYCTVKNTGSGVYNSGGGVYAGVQDVAITSSRFYSNSADLNGGGVYVESGNVTIENSTFEENSVVTPYDGKGGGVCARYGTLSITGSKFLNNSVSSTGSGQSTRGGGAYAGSSCTIDNSTFECNNADGATPSGGGLYVAETSAGTSTITGSTFTQNTATSVTSNVTGGGACFINEDVYITASTFCENEATSEDQNAWGGGVYVKTGNVVVDDGSAFILNRATAENEHTANGGGVCIATTGNLTIQDSSFTQNIAAGESYATGGGGYIGDGTLTISNSQFTENEAISEASGARGGAVYTIGDSMNVQSSIFTGNKAAITSPSNISGAGAFGGAVHAYTSSTIIDSSTFAENAVATVNGWAYGGGVFASSPSGQNAVSITGETIFRGNTATTTAAGSLAYGGGLYTYNNITTINGATFEDNAARSDSGAAYGGGLYARSGADIIKTTFDGNEARSANDTAGGGGVATYGVLTVSDNSTFTENRAEGPVSAYGGGIYCDASGSVLTMTDVTFQRNEANSENDAQGGGVSVVAASNRIITGSTFTENNAICTGSGTSTGGGVSAAGQTTVTSCTFQNNLASAPLGAAQGGGVSSGALVISGSRFEDNTAEAGALSARGGGTYSSTSMQFTDSTFINNTATGSGAGYGGGMYLNGSMAMLAEGTSYFTGNSATTEGGAIYTDAYTDYNNLTSTDYQYHYLNYNGAVVYFSGNTASALYAPPQDADTAFSNLNAGSVSAFDHPLNNYDINFAGGLRYYALTYDDNHSSPSQVYDDGIYSDGGAATVKAYSDTGLSAYSGYTFQNWNTQADGSGTSYAAGDSLTVTVDTVLYAQWKKDSSGGGGGTTTTYSVTYNANGGAGSYRDANLSKGTSYTILTHTDAGISYSGYTFAGWNTAADGSGTGYTAGQSVTISGSITLYAVWREGTDALRVTYYASDATSGAVPVDSNLYSEGDTVTLLYNTGLLRKSGYYFSGWAFSETGGTVLRPSTQFVIGDADVQLYARWGILSSGGSQLETLYDADVPLAALTTDHIWYIQGYPDNSVRPEGNLTRAEAAAIFYRLIDDESGKAQTGYTISFSDVSQADWYYHEVSYLTNRGILFG